MKRMDRPSSRAFGTVAAKALALVLSCCLGLAGLGVCAPSAWSEPVESETPAVDAAASVYRVFGELATYYAIASGTLDADVAALGDVLAGEDVAPFVDELAAEADLLVGQGILVPAAELDVARAGTAVRGAHYYAYPNDGTFDPEVALVVELEAGYAYDFEALPADAALVLVPGEGTLQEGWTVVSLPGGQVELPAVQVRAVEGVVAPAVNPELSKLLFVAADASQITVGEGLEPVSLVADRAAVTLPRAWSGCAVVSEAAMAAPVAEPEPEAVPEPEPEPLPATVFVSSDIAAQLGSVDLLLQHLWGLGFTNVSVIDQETLAPVADWSGYLLLGVDPVGELTLDTPVGVFVAAPVPVLPSVPEVYAGMPAQDAVLAVEAAGLVANVASEYSDTVPADCLVWLSPAPGIQVEPGSVVNLYMSLGAEPAPVPTTAFVPEIAPGTPAADAEQQILAVGLAVAYVEQYDAAVPAGCVVATDPAAGSELALGSTVTVVVSLGAEPAPEPVAPATADIPGDLAAQLGDVATVVQYLQGLGFTNLTAVDQATGQVLSDYAGRLAVSVEPVGEVALEAPVRVLASVPYVAVPEVYAGSSAEEAQAALEAAGFVPEVAERYDETLPAGAVCAVNPLPGTQLPYGSTVSVTVSLGAEPAPVPEPAAPQPVSVELWTTVALQGAQMQGGEFQFWITDLEGNQLFTDQPNAVNDAAGKVSFGVLVYTEPGVYSYVVNQLPGTAENTVYDASAMALNVEVQLDEAANALYVVGMYGEPAGFTNVYEKPAPQPVQVQIATQVGLEGAELVEGAYVFELVMPSGAPVPASNAAFNAADGSVSFGNATFTAPGTYAYQIVQRPGADVNTTYDAAVLTLTVQVELDEAANVLVASTACAPDTFLNVYTEPALEPADEAAPAPQAASAQLLAQINLVGAQLQDGLFWFGIAPQDGAPAAQRRNAQNDAAGFIDFGIAIFEKAGTYTYEVSQHIGNDVNVNYDAAIATLTVQVELDEANNVLVASSSIAPDTFVNVFAPLAHEDEPATPESAEAPDATEDPATSTPEPRPSQPADTSNQGHPTQAILAASVAEEGSGTPDPGTVALEVVDTLGNLVTTGTNDASGVVRFDPVVYEQPGEYVYTVRVAETPAASFEDPAQRSYQARVSVTETGNGLLAAVSYPDGRPSFTVVSSTELNAPATEVVTPNEVVAPSAGQAAQGSNGGSVVPYVAAIVVGAALIIAAIAGVVYIQQRNRGMR